MRTPFHASVALASLTLACCAPSLSTPRAGRDVGEAPDAAASRATSATGGSAAPTSEAPTRETKTCAARIQRSVKVSSRSSSTIAIAEGEVRRVVYVADSDNSAVHILDADGPTEIAVTELPGRPAALLPLADGRVLVTLRDKNRLVALELGEKPEDGLHVLCERPTYTEPFGIAASADGSRVAVTSGWDHKLMIFDAAELALQRSIDLPAEPRGVLLSSDGDSAYVAHMIGGIVSTVSLARVDEAPLRTFLRPALPAPPPTKRAAKSGANAEPADAKDAEKSQELASGQGFALAELSIGSDGGEPWPARVFIPMATSDPMRFSDRGSFPGVYGGRGGPAVIGALVAVIDPKGRSLLGGEVASLRDARPEDCILPRGIALHNNHILVTCLGTDSLVELDARAADPITAERRRFGVGSGPTGVAVDAIKERALVYSQWSGEVNVVDLREAREARQTLEAREARETLSLRLATKEAPALSPKLARGRVLFHKTRDVRISFDGRACASCHPDGRADGLTWATPDGPRQTISLAGRVPESGPFGWFGDHPTAKAHVAFTVSRLGGHGFASASDVEDLDALMAYVASLPGPSREGAIAEEGERALRERGRELFFSAEAACSTCHLERDGDGKRHDVGSGDPREKSRSFDTPALRFVAASAPYFHDGRYATLMDLLSDPASKMGRSAGLPIADRRALAAYLESL